MFRRSVAEPVDSARPGRRSEDCNATMDSGESKNAKTVASFAMR
jgi:hypothetical protein